MLGVWLVEAVAEPLAPLTPEFWAEELELPLGLLAGLFGFGVGLGLLPGLLLGSGTTGPGLPDLTSTSWVSEANTLS